MFAQEVVASEMQLAKKVLHTKGGHSDLVEDASRHMIFSDTTNTRHSPRVGALDAELSLADLLSDLSQSEVQRFVELRSKLLNYKLS